MSAAEALPTIRDERKVKLLTVATEQVEAFWPVAYELLQKADVYTNGRYGAHTMLESILAKDRLLMLAVDVNSEPMVTYAAFVAECNDYPGTDKRVFSIILAGGSHIDRWKHLYPAFKDKARSYGANQLEIIGRRGWKRILPQECAEASTVFIDEVF